ncbi:hypothetical protein [Psychrobacillus lasiicapitis]|uniref:Uncharacterized protein n=1 Tax=Psychrobacillus lasiicapitis TaxID=1636719 RepID=A0A544TAA6_9BACI|nr:hypothetical protein [Psychrobacillus lasiicapitis]TQR14397.1 hypothetical protein FG382_08035 [Psychrobacillus lasiicapitis]GGA31700.1 hypothetical protein GCM10011384_21540 [Psychrobacillus lasiicapitis]
MDAVSFWDMTYAEIYTSIKAYQKRKETDLQTQAVISYHQANLLSHLIGIQFGSKQAQKELHEAFPGIFPKLEKQAEQQRIKQQKWQVMKARIDAYAAEKRKRGESRGNDARRTANTDNN